MLEHYEFYTGITRYINRHGSEGAVDDFAKLMPWGTPDQVLEKIAYIRDTIDICAFNPGFSYGGMPYAEAQKSLDLFVSQVMPELKTWETRGLTPVQRRNAVAV